MRSCTIVCIDDVRPETGWAVCQDTFNKLRPHMVCKTKFFSSKVPNDKKGVVERIKIRPITSQAEYSKFVLLELLPYIDTELVFIVQWDGFILHPEKFETIFFDYDYIGSPVIWERGGQLAVGNGGFCIRSRRLMEAYVALGVTHRLEDRFICFEHRLDFEFAPVEVAKRFGHDIYTMDNNQFGFHNWQGLEAKIRLQGRVNPRSLMSGHELDIYRINQLLGKGRLVPYVSEPRALQNDLLIQC